MTVTRPNNPPAERARLAVKAAAEPCDYCKSLIVWTVNANTDVPMPVDAAPAADGGNVVVTTGVGPGRLISSVLGTPRQRQATAAAGHDLHLHHRLSCPYADEWGRPGGPKRGSYATRMPAPKTTRRAPARGRRR